MGKGRLFPGLFAMYLLAAVLPTAAHHGWLVDRANEVTLKGTVTSFSFSNPHMRVYFDVKEANGNIEKWVGEGGSANLLSRMGWNSDTLKPGDEITATGFRFRNSSNNVLLQELISPRGRAVWAGNKNRLR